MEAGVSKKAMKRDEVQNVQELRELVEAWNELTERITISFEAMMIHLRSEDRGPSGLETTQGDQARQTG